MDLQAQLFELGRIVDSSHLNHQLALRVLELVQKHWYSHLLEHFHVDLGHLAAWGRLEHHLRGLADLLLMKQFVLVPPALVCQVLPMLVSPLL
jgi:hypothetical protein